MNIGIDVSQVVYEGSGVARYVKNLVPEMIRRDKSNRYVIFGSAMREYRRLEKFALSLKKINSLVILKLYPFPNSLLNILWNRLHIFPVEWLTGPLDIFWSSDWTQPPLSGATGVTTVFDLVYLRFPEETNPRTAVSGKNLQLKQNIVNTQKRRIRWVKKECQLVLTDSMATRNDVVKLLGISPEKIKVVYPGLFKLQR